MTAPDRERLASIFGPLLPLLPPHLRAEATRLLGPVAREEFPEHARTADAWPMHEHGRTDASRF